MLVLELKSLKKSLKTRLYSNAFANGKNRLVIFVQIKIWSLSSKKDFFLGKGEENFKNKLNFCFVFFYRRNLNT